MRSESYRSHFSKDSFLKKTNVLTGKLMECVLLLYLVMTEEKTPAGVRLAIVASLGYFIWVFDAIPDYLPFGYSDDLAILTALLVTLDCYITPEMLEQVKNRRRSE